MYKHTNAWLNQKIRNIKNSCEYRWKNKKLPCSLTTEQLRKLFEKESCFYCGEIFVKFDPRHNKREIDRFDNNKGYTADNCVMSCSVCNHIKGNILIGDPKLKKMQNVIDKLSIDKKTVIKI